MFDHAFQGVNRGALLEGWRRRISVQGGGCGARSETPERGSRALEPQWSLGPHSKDARPVDLQVSLLKDFTVIAKDGAVGRLVDVLFDDLTWLMRWVVIDTGHWLSARRVLVHPTAVGSIDVAHRSLTVKFSKAQIAACPVVPLGGAISPLIDTLLHGHYGSDPHWGNSSSGECWPPAPLIASPLVGGTYPGPAAGRPKSGRRNDPDLLSLEAVTGYTMHATDGEIGRIEDIVVDDSDWRIRSLRVATSGWWPEKHVLLSPSHVVSVQSSHREFRVDLTRQGVKNGP